MKIWVDADACPVVIKEVLFKAADRTNIQLTLVANHFMRIPTRKNIHFMRVSAGFDVADNAILKHLDAGDLVITNDIPLADEIIDKGGHALSPRGELFSPDSIKARLSMRNLMDTLRGSGIESSGPPPLSQSDRQAFASHLDHFLSKRS